MIILNCDNISLSFGIDKILENISFSLQNSDKVGLVGVNGAGKSTLFNIISGKLLPDEGNISIPKDISLAILEQNTGLNSDLTLWNEILTAYSHIIQMESKIKNLENEIAVLSSSDHSDPTLERLMKQYSTISEEYSRLGGFEYKSRAKGILRGLGFGESQFNLTVDKLSGGQKTRLALAKLLIKEPDILLLDEPTNHLDINAIEWLEEFLKSYSKCVFVISHDRYFLDKVTQKTIEVENCKCKIYSGNYSRYLKQKVVDREIQLKHFENQQKEINKMKAFIEQQRRWNREKNIIAAESRQKAIDRMEKIEKPKNLPDKIKIKFRSSIVSGNDVLFVEDLSKEFKDKKLFSNLNFKIFRNEKVFILGPNGCGKSTLLKILSGNLNNTSGNFEYGHKVSLGYYDQELQDLDDNNTVLDEVWDNNDSLPQTQIRNTLASFLFEGDDVFKKISILSGGEKSRVSLAKLMLSGNNFLILDEPTNHLDINSREILEQSLQDFDGTILAVSHDRYFINKLATRILEFNKDSLNDIKGNYNYYLEQKSKSNTNHSNSDSQEQLSVSKMDYLEEKEMRAKQRKLAKQLKETEENIEKTESRLKEIESLMISDELQSDHVKLSLLHSEQSQLEVKLEELYEVWEELSLIENSN